jgi:hypothetical protein
MMLSVLFKQSTRSLTVFEMVIGEVNPYRCIIDSAVVLKSKDDTVAGEEREAFTPVVGT